jgi:very-short-patch-repair endonuclease
VNENEIYTCLLKLDNKVKKMGEYWMLNKKIELWKKNLLDMGKRNRLLNYKQTKRSNIKIVAPGIDDLYQMLVINEKDLSFPHPLAERIVDGEIVHDEVSEGDIKTDRGIKDQQITLRSLRSKANSFIQEQGINVFYVCFGFIKWKEDINSSLWLISPLVLVPVSLTIKSVTDPFVLSLHEDEIVVNPTLVYKMENDFGIEFPQFDENSEDVTSYLDIVNKEIASKNNWEVINDCELSLLSFLKINMYNDLNANSDKIEGHPIIKALGGDMSGIDRIPEELSNYDHDSKTKPQDIFQVVEADSSQQDAVLYSKNGYSFVLQGPPGTGKSQTITNIIAEGLADGKKVLFVSEKMAALKVVYNKLEMVGLGDFCLPLHSYKANKREVLESLGKTLKMDRKRIKPEFMYDLERLLEERNKLNDYNNDLHIKNLPLNKSIYEVNGLLSKLPKDTVDLVFPIDSVEDTDLRQLNKYRRLLDELTNTIGLMRKDYKDNPWIGCNITNLTHDLRQTFHVNLEKLIPSIANLKELYKKTCVKFDIKAIDSVSNVLHLIESLDCASRIPMVIPEKWILSSDIEYLIKKSNSFNDIQGQFFKLKSELLNFYDDNVFTFDAKGLLKKTDDLHTQLVGEASGSNYQAMDTIIDDMDDLKFILPAYIGKLEAIISQITEFKDKFAFIEDRDMKDIEKINNIVSCFLLDPQPTALWFDENRKNIFEGLLNDVKEKYEFVSKTSQSILAEFEMEIFNIDCKEILSRFRTEYANLFKIFKSDYWNEKKRFASIYKNKAQKIDDSIIVDALEKVQSLNEAKDWIKRNEDIISDFLGDHYMKEYTSWNLIDSAIHNFDTLKDLLGNHANDDSVKKFLIGGIGDSTWLVNLKNDIDGLYEQKTFTLVNKIIKEYKSISINELQRKVLKYSQAFSEFNAFYNLMMSTSKDKYKWDDILSHLHILSSMQNLINNIESQKSELINEFQFMFNDIDTRWEEIIVGLKWVETFNEYRTTLVFSEDFIKMLCTDMDFKNELIAANDELKASVKSLGEEWEWFTSQFEDRSEFEYLEFTDLISQLKACSNGMSYLEEWTDYRRHRQECYTNGLGYYVEKAEDEGIIKTQLVNAFLKRFYRLWLDIYVSKYPSISEFRRKTHEDRIHHFQKLDKSQLEIARARVKERLISRLPDIDRSTSAFDEIGILKRELSKKRKVMPLRKLFNNIPNLLTILKPCLMMSPLSVSLFLQADGYQFDMVIFDEASQVQSQDAVGAIMRSKQVIICGDNKQLPPTNFFGASLSGDEDYDIDDLDEDEAAEFESILDEANTVIDERTLKWHYRSRHEHLIAFSNAKIYNNNLITFPSSYTNVSDTGVEYIYVNDGLYDRGKSRSNINEAKRVAELVLEHMKKQPNRSLGIVTFSVPQQQAVENEIRYLRLNNQSYEDFFNEEKFEPFFIKNLENVQGDERDTIIFSIGYAKDGLGKPMAMNFGPLSKKGGERRLNVAITRAKYNVKLVGSIRPTDIDLERTNSEGVKLLRSYIDFAINGEKTLLNEIRTDEIYEADSPFEESVYNFLVENGYEVSMQVGCAGYRIDLAVKHPQLNGRYVLGIECDGATYHSARTARERDRIRQSVLEDIGWSIYRIWSTDWIKHPISEGDKLLERVKKSIEEYEETDIDNHESLGTLPSSSDKYLDEVEYDEESSDNPFGFVTYEEVDIKKISNLHNAVDAIKFVVEKESPIHFDLLSQRLASMFGRQKATKVVKDFIKRAIRNISDDVKIKGDFYWWKNTDEVKVKIPTGDQGNRPIEYISIEELAEAQFKIAQNSYGITKDVLSTTVARQFGFNRSGNKIASAINQATNYLIASGRVNMVDDKIIAKQ